MIELQQLACTPEELPACHGFTFTHTLCRAVDLYYICNHFIHRTACKMLAYTSVLPLLLGVSAHKNLWVILNPSSRVIRSVYGWIFTHLHFMGCYWLFQAILRWNSHITKVFRCYIMIYKYITFFNHEFSSQIYSDLNIEVLAYFFPNQLFLEINIVLAKFLVKEPSIWHQTRLYYNKF